MPKVSAGPVERVRAFIDEIGRRNDDVNAFIRVYADEALAQAEAVQSRMDAGTAGPLAGMVFGIKDVLSEKGRITSCGSRILHDFEAVYDATVVARLKAADAVLLGRVNMDEFAMGSSTEHTIYGPTRHPADLSRVPGGSSGGSAAAVAAGFCDASLGSDTGGSIRQPAGFCGVVGLKPSYGRVSRYGLVAYASSFDSVGPITHSVSDAARVLRVIAGRDPHDMTSSDKPVPDYSACADQPIAGLRIGVPEEYFGDGLDPEIRERVMATVESLESLGAVSSPIRLPHARHAIATYYILATAEASSNLARFDGVRYGHRATALESDPSALTSLYKQSRSEGFGTEVKRRIMLGTYVLSAGYYDAYYGKAQRIRRLIQQDFKDAFSKVDVIVSPTSPTTAFRIGENIDDPVRMYLNDIYTTSANLAGICGISIPVGTHSDGLPIGLQFMADSFREDLLIRAGAAVERIRGGV
jgi:aspartyl-tRNA(Asn)/glutamyl-tRNA(Gln) amidotransferase subunit A